MNSQNHGILRSWYEDRGFGVVQVPNSRTQRYFLHASQIVEGPDCIKVGYEVSFDIAPPYKDGQLQQAVNAKVSAPRPSTASLIDLLGVQS
jgi:hypothetical protein